MREAALADLKISPGAFGITLADAGRPVAAAGFVDIGGGRAHAWTILSDEIRARPMVFHRLVKRLLPDLIAVARFSDVYLDVDASFPQGLIWAQRLGFRPVMIRDMHVTVINAVTGREHLILRWDHALERVWRDR